MNAPAPEKLDEAVMRKLCAELDRLAQERARAARNGARPPSNWLVRLIGDLGASVAVDARWQLHQPAIGPTPLARLHNSACSELARPVRRARQQASEQRP